MKRDGKEKKGERERERAEKKMMKREKRFLMNGSKEKGKTGNKNSDGFDLLGNGCDSFRNFKGTTLLRAWKKEGKTIKVFIKIKNK